MALIICKTCGKKVSDTAKACIHCGEPILCEEGLQITPVLEEKKEDNVISATISDSMVKFKSLGEIQQEELVHAFWKADKIAIHYQKKKLILDYLKEGFLFLILPPALSTIFLSIFRFKVQSPDLLIFVLASCVIGIAAYGLKALLFKIVEKLTVNRKVKRLTYEKRFQAWAKTEKKIDYTPVFTGKNDEQMFEQINIDTFKL